MLSRISRLAVARRIPRRVPHAVAAPVRPYTNGRTEGSVAQSKGFNKKEKAHEDQYVHKHEMEQLAKLKAEIEAKRQELSSLQEQHTELESKAVKK